MRKHTEVLSALRVMDQGVPNIGIPMAGQVLRRLLSPPSHEPWYSHRFSPQEMQGGMREAQPPSLLRDDKYITHD